MSGFDHKSSRDADLLTAIAARDDGAMEELFERYRLRLYRYIVRLVRDEGQAADLVNEVFMEVWCKAERFEGRSSVSTWLLAIAHNKSVSALRRKREVVFSSFVQTDDESSDDDWITHRPDDRDTPDIVAAKRDKAAVLYACIERLPPKHREVIDLVYYQEQSIAAVAEIIGTPQNTIKTRLFHARKQLLALLEQANADSGWP